MYGIREDNLTGTVRTHYLCFSCGLSVGM